MIYVYRQESSVSARDLARELRGVRVTGRIRPLAERLKADDHIICWGEFLNEQARAKGAKHLNGVAIQNKLEDALALINKGIPTINVSKLKPAPPPPVPQGVQAEWEAAIEAAEDFVETKLERESPVYLAGIKELVNSITNLQNKLLLPPLAAIVDLKDWLPRLFNHVGGNDLLHPPAAADFWAKKENVIEEVRIHSFQGKSIRAGIKKPRVGLDAPHHPWIRSYDGGWFIDYDGFESKKVQRELAHAAVEALKLDFGAVDLGKLENKKWIVLEVNRAPGLEGGTVTAYAKAINKWVGV